MGSFNTKSIIQNKMESNNGNPMIEKESQKLDNMESQMVVNEIIQQLEQDGYDKLKKLQPNHDISQLLQIMSEGTKEFEKKTGRQMSYAEMRSAYG